VNRQSNRLVAAVLVASMTVAAGLRAQDDVLKIVVIEGEGGVNIIDKKTAVRPVVEVRDRNDLPVAGVAVRFDGTRVGPSPGLM
jgi:hypothetical protein